MDREYLLWLVMVCGAGNPLIWRVLDAFGSVDEAYEMLHDEVCQNELGINERQKRVIACTQMKHVQQLIDDCAIKDISIETYKDEQYPKLLEGIANPPSLLFYRGNIGVLSEPSLTVVGTRAPQPYYIKAAERICSDVSAFGITIVSGFAVGLDTAAHKAAILSGGKTAAVLGCGLDVNYPKENSDFKKSVACNGVLITEFLPGTSPYPGNFPVRNRILSGVSHGTFVVQAPERSGSLITAGLALEQGRKVFCLPPADIFDKRYAGVVKYLREGATAVYSHLDIIDEYYNEYPHKLKPSVVFEEDSSKEDSPFFGNTEKKKTNTEKKKTEKSSKKSSAKSKPEAEKKEPKGLGGLSSAAKHEPFDIGEVQDFVPQEETELSRRIIALLKEKESMRKDDIIETLDADAEDVAVTLTELCMENRIRQVSSSVFSIL